MDIGKYLPVIGLVGAIALISIAIVVPKTIPIPKDGDEKKMEEEKKKTEGKRKKLEEDKKKAGEEKKNAKDFVEKEKKEAEIKKIEKKIKETKKKEKEIEKKIEELKGKPGIIPLQCPKCGSPVKPVVTKSEEIIRDGKRYIKQTTVVVCTNPECA